MTRATKTGIVAGALLAAGAMLAVFRGVAGASVLLGGAYFAWTAV